MSTAANRNYTVRKEEGELIFETPSYKFGPDSVLHSGIYNREFSSALASAAVAGIVYMIVAANTGHTIVKSAVFLLTFAAGVPFFRKFVFKEDLMEVVFNTAEGEAKIYRTWISKSLKETISIKNIHGLRIESRRQEVENPDAVKFVKHISLQHGTVIPGFGEEKVLFLLKLHLSDGSERTIYSDSNMQDVITAYDEIKGFLGLA